ncbi:MAG: TraR/DksA family transcriptional regulator [Chitinophagales bacterium]|nr:TraR/DksA family transcriptional regulator [Chitinophagales bacterium]
MAKSKTRYSDKELAEFKDLINKKIKSARDEMKFYQEQIMKKTKEGETDYKYNGLEDGAATMEKEYLSQMAARQMQYISHLEKALMRIENKTYGVCRKSGILISKQRLKAVPHATLSIEAKRAQSR